MVTIAVAMTLIAIAATAHAAREAAVFSVGNRLERAGDPEPIVHAARTVFKARFVSYNGQHKTCSEGFRCTIQGNQTTGASTETCIRGRKEVIGRGGP